MSLPDLSHHLSDEVHRRTTNPMKNIWRQVYGKPLPNLITLAGGEPHQTLFPISSITFDIPHRSTLDSVANWRDGNGSVEQLTSYKGLPPPGKLPSALDLKASLQYGVGTGLLAVREPLRTLTNLIHSPPNHVNHDLIMCLGNADAVNKVFRLLGNPGDTFLFEEFSFPGVTYAPSAFGVKMKPVKMDKEGLLPEDLDRIMREWNTDQQGKRPHVLYTIPVGQNPTGATMSFERLKSVYKVAQKWDIVIIEDDPYYFLQFGDYLPFSARAADSQNQKEPFSSEIYAKKLFRSFLSIDTDGRVIRLDTFSKVIAPGMRLGWITANPTFRDGIEELTDASTQQPSALSQTFIAELFGINGWGIDGFLQWTSSIAREYQRRRDLFLDVFYRDA